MRKSGDTYTGNCACLPVRDRPEAKEEIALWFHERWHIPLEAYRESIDECLGKETGVPQWYVVMRGSRIIAGCGVIGNDFHERKDLTPNVCAVFVEEDCRNRGVAGYMLKYVCEDMSAMGYDTLYLLTDHTGFYERYGWGFLCMARGNDGELSRMYVHHMQPGKWIQSDQLRDDPDNLDALLEAADLTRQLIRNRNYTGIGRIISYTVENDYYECFSWILDLLQEEFEKTEAYDLEDFYCDLGKSIPDFEKLAGRLEVDFNVQDHKVEKVFDEHGEVESFFNNFTYRTGYRNIFLASSENFDTKDNDYIQYRLLFRR